MATVSINQLAYVEIDKVATTDLVLDGRIHVIKGVSFYTGASAGGAANGISVDLGDTIYDITSAGGSILKIFNTSFSVVNDYETSENLAANMTLSATAMSVAMIHVLIVQ